MKVYPPGGHSGEGWAILDISEEEMESLQGLVHSARKEGAPLHDQETLDEMHEAIQKGASNAS